MTVSLIITTYNWVEALELVLQSGMHQTTLPSEIIIADDGSGRETEEMIVKIAQSTSIPLYHIWQEDQGFRAASIRNKAIRKAASEYIIMVDGDMILDTRFIEDHLRYAQKGVFLQGSRVLLSQKKTSSVLQTKQYAFSYWERGMYNRKNMIHSRWLCTLFSHYKDTISGVRTCNFSLYKEDIYSVNGFDEMFVGWGREDSEFAVRLLNRGIKRKDIKFHAVAYHLYHSENTRKTLSENDKRLKESVDLQKTWCDKGLIC